MPIDEAEGIGSNFDLLERIAEAKDYQLISMSINPLMISGTVNNIYTSSTAVKSGKNE